MCQRRGVLLCSALLAMRSCRFLADLLGAFPFEVIAGGSFNEQERLQLTMLRGLKCLRLVRLARSDMRAGCQLAFE